MTPIDHPVIRFGLRPLLAGWVDPALLPELEVCGLSLDSRQVRPGDLFLALSGQRQHGLSAAPQAVERGCAAIAFDPAGAPERPEALGAVPCIAVEGLAHKLGAIADRFFGEPSRYLRAVIGITGTNGKTSCSHFLAQALACRWPTAVAGTLGWGPPGALAPTTHTTPDAIEVHRLLLNLYRRGFQAVAMEASSHGLVQGRLNGVRFKGALFTNLGRDHLDYHPTLAAYLEAKLKLMTWPDLEFAVFNADSPVATAVLERLPSGTLGLGFSATGRPLVEGPQVVASEVRHGSAGITFQAQFEGQKAQVQAPVFGDFNVENLTATLAVLVALGFSLEEAAALLGNVRAVPGRMESFTAAGTTVIVDYAHTPDALRSVLTSLRRHCRGRLWAVFGCGGDRDRGKRPEMGAVADALADRIVLTDDNPRSEDGDAILRQILAGCRRRDIVCIRDRRAAIEWTLAQARAVGDIVLVAGKGHETTQEVGGRKYPFSDRQVVQEILARMEAPA
ncbi:UDP-N-acetylmuramoyl-L-alanyl-D-glutamate--2,6-diaminopimelate ligase [Candidatus Methylocalor cossyra]|uniref:UDP-N-acetylmuramoyl-L-alanyl-D-glutamate--2,6-diaminopimelate ligase n=1 Tax=Candidatus Methylocalor cossyra TaxID=3108543 RepID=A0ABM9NHV6_9GAMM